MHEVSVLVVDDDPDFLTLVSSELRRLPGVSITTASSPYAVINLLHDHSYQLIVSDWQVSTSTGPEILLEAEREPTTSRRPRTPVLFMSGDDRSAQAKILASRFKGFLPVSFISKRRGPATIRKLSEHILQTFSSWRMQPC